MPHSLRTVFYRDFALSFLLYLLVAIIITWPVVTHLTTGLAGDPGRDNLQFTWNLWWMQEALLNQQVNPSEVTMLHWPDGGENQLLGLSLLLPVLALPTTLLGGPVLSYNLWFLLSFALVGASGWLLTYYVTGDRRAAFVGGLIFGTFPHKSFHATGHYLQIMIFLFPLYAIGLLRLFHRASFRQAWVTSVTLALCLLVNLVHVGFFLLPMSVLLLAYHLWQVGRQAEVREKWLRQRGPLWLGVMLLIAFGLTLPILWPFLAGTLAGNLGHYQLPGVVSFSSDLLSYVTPSPHHPFLQNKTFEAWSAFLLQGNLEENVAYMGLTVLILALWGAWRQREAARRWLIMAVVMAVLALGPFLKVGGKIIGQGSGVEIDGVQSWFLMPYAALMQLLPFYQWGRIPNRQIMVTMLALSVLAGLGIASLRHKPKQAWFATGVVSVLIVIEYLVMWPYPMGSTALLEQPIWRELRQEGRGAVLSLPQWDFFSFTPSNESMLVQIAHGQPIVGGYIHRLPPGSAANAKAIQELIVPPAERDIVPLVPQEQALAALQGLDIATILIHRDARSEHIWDDEDEAAAISTLRTWLGEPRWSNTRFMLFDVPDRSQPLLPPTLWTLDAHWQGIEGLPDEARRWMPDEAEVWLWSPTAQEHTILQLDAQSFNGPRTLTILLNDEPIWQGAMNERTLIQSPAVTLEKGHNRITFFLAEGCQRPTDLDANANDGRCLGLLVHGVSLPSPHPQPLSQ